jgi:hypothetical protein
MKNGWICNDNGDYSLASGRILVVSVEIGYGIVRDEIGSIRQGDPECYRIFVQNPDYVYGEGLSIMDKQEFNLSEEGLRAAKKRAVVFARELLTEAMESLDKFEVSGYE